MHLYHYNAFFPSLFLPSLFSPHFPHFSLQFLFPSVFLQGWISKQILQWDRSQICPLWLLSVTLCLWAGWVTLTCDVTCGYEQNSIGQWHSDLLNLFVVRSVDWPDSSILHPSISEVSGVDSQQWVSSTCAVVWGVFVNKVWLLYLSEEIWLGISPSWAFTVISIFKVP